MKSVFWLLFAGLLVFVAWPYYRIYQIDDALGYDDPEALARMVDLEAVRAGTMKQLDASMQAATGRPEEGSLMDWVQDSLHDLGGDAVDKLVDLAWVHAALQRAARQAIDEPPYYFMRGIDYAFDEADLVFLSVPPFRHNDRKEDFLDIDTVVDSIQQRGVEALVFSDAESLLPHLMAHLVPGDVALIMSNGSFGGIHDKLLDNL